MSTTLSTTKTPDTGAKSRPTAVMIAWEEEGPPSSESCDYTIQAFPPGPWLEQGPHIAGQGVFAKWEEGSSGRTPCWTRDPEWLYPEDALALLVVVGDWRAELYERSPEASRAARALRHEADKSAESRLPAAVISERNWSPEGLNYAVRSSRYVPGEGPFLKWGLGSRGLSPHWTPTVAWMQLRGALELQHEARRGARTILCRKLDSFRLEGRSTPAR